MPRHKQFSHLKFPNTHSAVVCLPVCVCVCAPKGFSRSTFVLLAFRSSPSEGDTHCKLDLAETETLLAVWSVGQLAASIIFWHRQLVLDQKNICQMPRCGLAKAVRQTGRHSDRRTDENKIVAKA